MHFSFKLPLLSIAMASTLGFAGMAGAQEVTGAGASFPAPIYSKWASDYNKATGVKVNYQSIGSGGGIKQIDSKTVDFGASDMPQTDDILKSKGQMQFPAVIGGTVPVINVKGIAPGQMKLDSQTLGDIYLGNQPHIGIARCSDRSSASCGWLWNHIQLHQLPQPRAPRVEGQSGRGHCRQLACGRWWQG
jgi:ABC-type phosphate transport system substrate-binding protein